MLFKTDDFRLSKKSWTCVQDLSCCRDGRAVLHNWNSEDGVGQFSGNLGEKRVSSAAMNHNYITEN